MQFDRRRTMAMPVAPSITAPPRERGRRGRPALYALLLAMLACLGGGILASTNSSPEVRPRRHVVPATPHPSPTAALPDGPRLTGIVDEVDARFGRLVIDVQGRRLAYGLHAQTLYPEPCLQAAALRRGRRVTLTLPWYMGGQAYVLAITPPGGCRP